MTGEHTTKTATPDNDHVERPWVGMSVLIDAIDRLLQSVAAISAEHIECE
jgi:hypothetical protein